MKKDRNCGNFPVYPQMAPLYGVPYGMPSYGMPLMENNYISESQNSLTSQINSLEKRITSLENAINKNIYSNYSTSNYQMM